MMTNSSAMIALQTLQQVSKGLQTTSQRTSTGAKVQSAADSAAYWAIATTARSDNGALGGVKDALSLGRATMDVAYNGLDAARGGLQEIRNLLIAARQGGVDRDAIQLQIDGILSDLQTKAGAATINGQNFLAVDSGTPGFTGTTDVVASFQRDGGSVSVSTIEVDVNAMKLTDSNSGDGILDESRTVNGTTSRVLDIDVASLTDSVADIQTLDDLIAITDAALDETVSQQNQLGSVLSRIDSQSQFVDALMDANDRAIGTLVDSRMEEEATRLRSLQTQNQLAIQSLNIAQESSNNVLALFR